MVQTPRNLDVGISFPSNWSCKSISSKLPWRARKAPPGWTNDHGANQATHFNRKEINQYENTCKSISQHPTWHCRGTVLMTNCQDGELIRVGRICEHSNRPSTTEWWPIEANSIVNTYCGKDNRDEHSDQRYWQFGSDILNEIATTGQPSSWSFENLGYTAITCYRRVRNTTLFRAGTPVFETISAEPSSSQNFQA